MSQNEHFVIRVKWGGLGDHLFHSHLPRIAKRAGYRRVLVSELSEYRDPELRRLIWQANPFVDGFTPVDAPVPEFATLPAGCNLLDATMLARGLDDGRRNHEPELFVPPRFREELLGRSVYDPNFVSFVGDVSTEALASAVRAAGGADFQLALRGSRHHGLPGWPTERTLRPQSLEEYLSMVHSAGRFLCLASGGATLAAALARPATVFFGRGQSSMFHHSPLHQFVEVSPGSSEPPGSGGTRLSRPASAPTAGSAEIRAFADELSRHLDPLSIRSVLDLGSRDGEAALAFRQLFPNAAVFAFECNPDALAICRRTLAGTDVTLVERAVSERSGFVDFFAIDPAATVTPHADGNIGASSLFRANPEYPYERYVQRRITVQAVRLDDWAVGANVPALDVLWMDVQGAELATLRGAGRLLDTVRAVYAEVSFRPVYHGQPLAGELDDFLQENGFVLVREFNRGDWMGDRLYVRQRPPKPIRPGS